MTARASLGAGEAAFSSISRVSSSWSRLPQLTPMRTGLPYLSASSMISENCRSRLALKPTLPGLMRYLSSASAQAGFSAEQRVAVVVEVADQRHGHAHLRQPVADVRHGLGGLVAVDRDAHDLGAGAGERRPICRAVASTSAVSVLVIDCTTMGASPPMITPPTSTGMDARRGSGWSCVANSSTIASRLSHSPVGRGSAVSWAPLTPEQGPVSP